MMERNVASQKWTVFAFNRTTNSPVTGDAANISAKIAIDGGSRTATNDTAPTETEDGYYDFDLTQAETNGVKLQIFPESSTSDVQVIGVPGVVFTTAANVSLAAIDSSGRHTANVTQFGGTNITASGGRPEVNLTHWRGTQPGNLDSNTYVPANLAAINGNLTRAANLASATDNYSATRGLSGTALPAAVAGASGGVAIVGSDMGLSATAIDNVWDEVLNAATHDVPNSAGQRLRSLGLPIEGVIADSPITTTTFISSLSQTQNDFYADQLLRFTTGQQAGQAKPILSYNGTTKVITLSEALTGTPEEGDAFVIVPQHIHPISQIADGVWDEESSGHSTAGTFGKALSDALTNTTTLLSRITSTLFNGITSLGGWLRLMSRKDAAAATDYAASLAEINSDGGSGSGDFTSTTDSLEGLRDASTPQTGDAYAYLTTNLGLLGANATEAGGTGDQFTDVIGADGDTLETLSDQLDAIPTTIRIKKNAALAGFPIIMLDTSGDPATGKTVTGTVSIDGAAFTSLTNAISEVSGGLYKVNLAAGDTNGNTLVMRFSATGCRTRFVEIVTQP